MSETASLLQKHSLLSETAFRAKIMLFTVRRSLTNKLVKRVARFGKQATLAGAPVITASASELWNADDVPANWILTAGKVENLRIAAAKLNGIQVKAGEVFSFWKHIGAPLKRRGYVVGREIREGCIVPTIAGGLCQLSNALYDAALKAGFEITERHAHTRVIKGSLAESDRDATVKWNYVDLRFKAGFDFIIAIDFTPAEMIVQFRGYQTGGQQLAGKTVSHTASKLNDCYSCGNTGCFKHPGYKIAFIKEKQATAFILDEKWPEFEQYVGGAAKPGDHFILPYRPGSFFKIHRHTWNAGKHTYTSFANTALQRAIALRIAAKRKQNIPSVYLRYDEQIVKAIKKAIPVECTHVVIAQNLLPFAWEQGLLWGRTFDVLMARLPMEILQQKLDAAHAIYPESKTLNDFRVEENLTGLENVALTKATRIITPHREIAGIFNNKAVISEWKRPSAGKSRQRGNKVLFPASGLARKGAYEVRQLVGELNLQLVLTGNAIEHEGFWSDVDTVYATDYLFNNIMLVVLPAYIEHQPRLLLRALAGGIPVIASSACGLPAMDGLTIIPAGDYNALKKAVLDVVQANQQNTKILPGMQADICS